MIVAIRDWLVQVVMAVLLVSVAESLLPAGTLKSLISLVGGLILTCTMLQPVLLLDIRELEIDYEDYSGEILLRQEEIEEENRETFLQLIEQETEAYILEKAGSLGITCAVEVEVRESDGIPQPYSVKLIGKYAPELAEVIEQDLAIPKERQVWHEAG